MELGNFLQLSETETGISNSLALMPRSDHSLAKYLTAPLQVSQTWDSSLLEIVNQAYETENIQARRLHELLWSQ
jgi:hypothetical protein